MSRSYKPHTFSYVNLTFLVVQDPKLIVLETVILSIKLGLLKNTGNLIPIKDFPFVYSLAAIPPFIIFYEGCQTSNN